MEPEKEKITIDGHECTVNFFKYSDEQKKEWKVLFDKWKELREGMLGFGARSPNFPEGLSESAFCMLTGSWRKSKVTYNKNKVKTSFDTYDSITKKTHQIKATTMKKTGLSSFGPKSESNETYLMDFHGKTIDGSFDLYRIEQESLENIVVNNSDHKTMNDHKKDGKRPRTGLKNKTIQKTLIAKGIKIWEQQELISLNH